MSGSTYQECGHCEKKVSLKTYKEHRRLYFHDGRWIKPSQGTCGEDSRSSSPMCVSDPHDSITEDPQSGNALLDDLYDEPESVFAELEVLTDPLQIGMCTHAASLLQCTHTTQPRSFEQRCSYWSGRKPFLSCGADGNKPITLTLTLPLTGLSMS